MSDGTNRDTGCRMVCWLIALVLGGASAWALQGDFGLDLPLAVAIGAFVAVVLGVLLRRLFCRAGRNRVARRIAEAAARADDRLPEPDANATSDAVQARLVDEAARIADSDMPSGQDRIEPSVTISGPGLGLAVGGGDGGGEGASDGASDGGGDGGGDGAHPAERDIGRKLAEIADNIKAEMGDDARPGLHLAGGVDKTDTTSGSASGDKDDQDPGPGPAAPQSDPAERRPVQSDTVVPSKPRPATPASADEADRLTRIDGLTAAHEAALNEAGIFSFDQLARMNKRELAWINENIINEGSARAELWRKIAIGFLRNRDEAPSGGDGQARAGGAKS